MVGICVIVGHVCHLRLHINSDCPIYYVIYDVIYVQDHAVKGDQYVHYNNNM